LPFSPSPKQILRYQEVVGHKPILDRMTKRPTTDAKALVKLRAKYVSDPLYPMILDFRKADKLAGTYIGRYEDGKVVGGFKVGKDGLVHAQFTNAPSTLRTSMRSPNLQNLPR
jgi:DNA polymerase I-like protein with 3'-5' exonuclease and polymerase domains